MDNFLDNLLAEALAPRVIRLVHKAKDGTETVLGNFLEKPCRAGRQLIPCDSPTCVCEEFVRGDYWLSPFHRERPWSPADTQEEIEAIQIRFAELIAGGPPDDYDDLVADFVPRSETKH